MNNDIIITSKEMDLDTIFKDMYQGSACTIEGCGTNIKEEIRVIKKELTKLCKKNKETLNIPKWWLVKGKEMNEYYRLTGDNAYKNNLNILAFDISMINVFTVTQFKLGYNLRWFDDVVANNLYRETNSKVYGYHNKYVDDMGRLLKKYTKYLR